MARLLEGGAGAGGLDAAQEASAEEELEALVTSAEDREAREGRLPEAPRHGAEREKEGGGEEEEEEEALPSAPTGAVSVVGGKEKEGGEAEEGAAGETKETERVPVLA